MDSEGQQTEKKVYLPATAKLTISQYACITDQTGLDCFELGTTNPIPPHTDVLETLARCTQMKEARFCAYIQEIRSTSCKPLVGRCIVRDGAGAGNSGIGHPSLP